MMDLKDILILSDFDGTFYPNEINSSAVVRFMKCGGKFSLDTGKSGQAIIKNNILPFVPNAPMVGLGGSQIYDLQNNKCTEQYFMSDDVYGIISDICNILPIDSLMIVKDDGLQIKLPPKELALSNTTPILKAVFSYKNNTGKLIPPEIEEYCKGKCAYSSNGENSLEINALGINKGATALKVKALTGAKKLICVGDWHGDISMLKAADVGCAVANAHPAVKSQADVILTKSCTDGAIAQLIQMVMDGII